MIHINWKKTAIATIDALLAVYLALAVTSFNKPDRTGVVCRRCNITIADDNTNGFLKADDVTRILKSSGLMPTNKQAGKISTRNIEEKLKSMAFVKTAQCFMAENGDVTINITQRLPLLRIKSETGDDYYIDERGGVMPNSNYVSDLIIATGRINRRYATEYLMPLAEAIMGNELWNNLFEQIHVTEERGIELVPRVGDHIVFIGSLPTARTAAERALAINKMLGTKLTRLEKFYRHGLSKTGWNRYDYINLEFDNQIICHKRRQARNTATESTDNTGVAPTEAETTAPQKKEPEAAAKAAKKDEAARKENKRTEKTEKRKDTKGKDSKPREKEKATGSKNKAKGKTK